MSVRPSHERDLPSRAIAEDAATDQVQLLLRGVPINFVVGVVSATACAWVLRGVESSRALEAWLAVYCALYLVRLGTWLRARTEGTVARAPSRWLLRVRLSVFSVGLGWAILPALLFPADPMHALAVALIACAVCGGGMAIYSADSASALLFVMPTVTAATWHLLLSGQTLPREMGVLYLLYIAFLLHATRRTHAQFQLIALHRARASAQLSRDPLTGLGNRLDLEVRLQQALARARRHGTEVALGYIDLDDFKPVNDSLGHAAGDALLRQLATRWRDELRSSELIARLGGDEFVLLVEDLDPQHAVTQLDAVVERLHRAVQSEFELAGTTARVGMTIGVARYPLDGTEADTLLRHADAAMYHGKKHKAHGRAGWWPARAQAGPSRVEVGEPARPPQESVAGAAAGIMSQ